MTDRFNILKNRLHGWINQGGSYEKSHRTLCDSYADIMYCLTLATEAEHMKERLRLFEIKGESGPSIVECCFSGQHKMTDKETIEHLFKWFKDFQNMLTYIEKQRNKCRDEAEQLRKERDDLAALVVGITRVYTDSLWDECILNTIELAKKVNENGNT